MSTFSIYLEPRIGVNLRRIVNDDVYFSINHQRERANQKPQLYPAWNRICALMDRIQDTAEHINNIELHNKKENRSAFSFLDLMNYGSVLKDCVYEIARIYKIDMETYSQSSSIFHMTGSDGNGTDKMYFEYLRSLCSIHPFDTGNRNHRRYQENDFECCPYVSWKDEHFRTDEYNYLIAYVYTNKEGPDHYKKIIIPLSNVIQYIEYTYQLLEAAVIPGIEAFKEQRREEFRSQIMKREEDFPSYDSYLRYLKEEARKRYGEDDCYIDDVLRFFQISFENKKNQKRLIKFQNALKLAVGFYHASLQNMDCEGYQNTGIYFPSEDEGTNLLHCLLLMQNNSHKATLYGYEIGTFSELCSETDPGYYAKRQLESIKEFLERFVSFDEAKTNIDYYILSQLALYADSLRNRNVLNQNIPNDLRYRFRRLGDNGWSKLHQENKRSKNSAVDLEEFLEL